MLIYLTLYSNAKCDLATIFDTWVPFAQNKKKQARITGTITTPLCYNFAANSGIITQCGVIV